MEYRNMESSISDISRFVLVDKKKWHEHLKKLFDIKENEFAIFRNECPDAPDCYYFEITKRQIDLN